VFDIPHSAGLDRSGGALPGTNSRQSGLTSGPNARSYVAWLQHLNSGAPGQFDPASLPRPLNRTQMIPALMASVFLQEPLARQIHRASSR